MTAPESQLFQLIFSLLLVLPSSYAVGRVHQWYTHSLRRDLAFREGYDHASHSMFDLAVQHKAAEPPAAPATVTPTVTRPRRRADAHTLTLRTPALPTVPLGDTTETPRYAEHPRTRVLPHVKTADRGRWRRGSSPR
ncbi:hypothetical protein [Actinoplanes sp. NPDC049599]|uniref:hypothetical protein n=1 Tax=Actinoplanes sp. NPDC049599 TaxID=3363903 RepID=UPI00378C07ED